MARKARMLLSRKEERWLSTSPKWASLRFMITCLSGAAHAEKLVIGELCRIDFNPSSLASQVGAWGTKYAIPSLLVLDTNSHITEAPRCSRLAPELASGCFGSGRFIQLNSSYSVLLMLQELGQGVEITMHVLHTLALLRAVCRCKKSKR